MPLGKGEGIFDFWLQTALLRHMLQLDPSLISTHSACWEHGLISSLPGCPMLEQQSFAPAGVLRDGTFHAWPGVGTSGDKAVTMKFKQKVMPFREGCAGFNPYSKRVMLKKCILSTYTSHWRQYGFFLLADENVCGHWTAQSQSLRFVKSACRFTLHNMYL